MNFDLNEDTIKILIKNIYQTENDNLRTGKSNEEMIKDIIKIIEEEVDKE